MKMIMIRLHRSRGQMDRDHVENLSLQACPISGSYRWFRLKDHFFDHATCAEPDHHSPQKKDQNTSCIKLPHYRIHHFAKFSYFSWYLTHLRNTWWSTSGASCWSSTSPWQRMSKRCLPWWREVWQQRWRCCRGRTDHQVPWQLHGQL